MISNRTPAWSTVIPILRCPACLDPSPLEESERALVCSTCNRRFPIRDGLLVVQDHYSGNNGIAAEFYNSSRWNKYRFWKRFTPFNDRAVTRWSTEVLAMLPNLEDTRLLDIAIGDGRNMPLLPESCEVYGIDISAAQLQACRDRYAERRLFLFHGEAESLPFEDDSMDNVLSFGAFNYFNDPLKSLQEMARVVKPGGHIVVTDEYADLPRRMVGSRLGWPALDHWIMSHLLHLGEEFTQMIEDHCHLEIEPIVEQVLQDWQIHSVCNDWAYCFIGQTPS